MPHGPGETVDTNGRPATAPFPYKSARQRAKVVFILFVVGIIPVLATIAVDIRQFGQMSRAIHHLPVTEAEIYNNYHWMVACYVAWMSCYLLTVVAFLYWIYRAHQNLPALGATELEFTPRGAVGWYFFPLLNLFKPYQVMREIYNGSDPGAPLDESLNVRGKNAPVVVKCWWTLFLLICLTGRAATIATNDADSPASFQFAAGASIVNDVAYVVALIAAASLVRSVDRRQEIRATALGLLDGHQRSVGD